MLKTGTHKVFLKLVRDLSIVRGGVIRKERKNRLTRVQFSMSSTLSRLISICKNLPIDYILRETRCLNSVREGEASRLQLRFLCRRHSIRPLSSGSICNKYMMCGSRGLAGSFHFWLRVARNGRLVDRDLFDRGIGWNVVHEVEQEVLDDHSQSPRPCI